MNCFFAFTGKNEGNSIKKLWEAALGVSISLHTEIQKRIATRLRLFHVAI